MSKFNAPDLSRLPKLPLVEPDFETTLSERMAAFETKATANGFQYDVSQLDSDPIKINQIVNSDREISIKAEINDQTRAVMLATSWGSYLDQIAATYYGISRLDAGIDPQTNEPAFEKDQDFKQRIALAPEAFSTAGPEGAYAFHALELDGKRDIADARAFGEEDGAKYNDGTLVLAPEILLVILPTPAYQGSNEDLMNRAYKAVTAKDVRPLGDKVTIEFANNPDYIVQAKIKIAPGADGELIKIEAKNQVQTYVDRRRKIGATVQRLGLGGALRVTDVTDIELVQPAQDIDLGSKGAATCTNIEIEVEIAEETWRTIL